MQSNAKVKSLLDELASVLAEMGAFQDEEPATGERSAVPHEDEDEDKEMRGEHEEDEDEDEDVRRLRSAKYGEEDEEKKDTRRARSAKYGEEDEEKARAAKSKDEVEDAEALDKEDAEKERKLRCLCQRAEKLRDKIKFYEGVAAKELQLRAVIDKSSPAGDVDSRSFTSNHQESRTVSIYHNLPGAGRLKNFRGERAEERAYRCGMFLRASVLGDKNAARWCADHGVESRAQVEGVNSLGGIGVVPELLNEIIVLVEQFGAYPANARNIQMKSDTLLIPRRVGGLQAYFVGENSAVGETDAVWDRVQLVCKKSAVANRISSELLEDTVIGLADYLTGEVARSIAELIDNCGFVGTGGSAHGKMIGAVTKIADGTHNAGLITAGVGNTSALNLDVDDLIATAGRLPVFARANAKWYCSPAVFAASVQRLGLVNNVGLSGGNTAANLSSATELRLLGSPVVFVHTMSGNIEADPGVVKFLYGDLSMSSIYATRRGLTIKTSEDRYLEQDATLMVATTRWDAVTHDCGDNEKAGPLVALRTAAV